MATCSAELWTYNTLNQSPCVVGAALQAVCQPGAPQIDSLLPGYVYDGPSAVDGQNTPCRCSSVYYSLLSACAWCQGGGLNSWSRYATNCATAYVGVFPRELPQGIAVPVWAFMDVTITNSWEPAAAKVLTGPEAVALTPTVATTPPSASAVTTTASRAPISTASAAGLDAAGGKNGATSVRRANVGALVIATLAAASLIL